MNIKKLQLTAVDWLLLVAIVGLVAVLMVLLLPPLIEKWQNRPRPGAQVCQTYDLQGDAKGTIGYLLYLPPEYDASKKWPFVVFLHGAGERGQDLNRLRRHGPPKLVDDGKQFGFILVSPQCPTGMLWTPELVVELTENVSGSLSVDRDRVYLTGFSMGGFAAWATACHDPDRFAAIAPLCGGGDPTQAKRLVNMPVWAFHGANDKTVPISQSQTMVDAFRECGGHVEFTAYPEVGHDICDVTYGDQRLYEWLLAQRRRQEKGIAR